MPHAKFYAGLSALLTAALFACQPHGAPEEEEGPIISGIYTCSADGDDYIVEISKDGNNAGKYIVGLPDFFKGGEKGWTRFTCVGEGKKIICRAAEEYEDPDDQKRYAEIEQRDNDHIVFIDQGFSVLYSGSGGGTLFPPDGALLTRK